MTKPKEKKIAIIVGRFQAHELHEGYKKALEFAAENYEKVGVIFGVSYRKFTKANTLPPQLRLELHIDQLSGDLIKEGRFYTDFQYDHKSDLIWTKNLDDKIDNMLEYSEMEDMVFIIGRDSFDSYYNGKFKDKFVVFDAGISWVSSSITRDTLKDYDHARQQVTNIKDFAAGMIHAVANQYPRVDSTVDIAPVFVDTDGDWSVLLGRKATDEPGKFRFFGGFVDATDTSLEHAAIRELSEESGIVKEYNDMMYIASHKIQDWRYRDKSGDGIMTTLFKVNVKRRELDEAVASDDLAGQELKRVKIDDLLKVIVPEHMVLASLLQNRYQ